MNSNEEAIRRLRKSVRRAQSDAAELRGIVFKQGALLREAERGNSERSAQLLACESALQMTARGPVEEHMKATVPVD